MFWTGPRNTIAEFSHISIQVILPPTPAVTQSGQPTPAPPTARVIRVPAKTPVLICTQPVTVLPREPVVLKPVEQESASRKAKFPADDFASSNNIINNIIDKEHINPPPDEAERRAGFCRRTGPGGRKRFICTT